MIECDVTDGIAHVRLNRPSARNALNLEAGQALKQVATRIASDTSVRAVLITGNGAVFSVGGDIEAFRAGLDDLPAVLTAMADEMHSAIALLAQVEAPIVTAVHGACAGGALALLYLADVALAAEGTKFATGFGRIGIAPDSGNAWYLPKFIGVRRASEMLFEDRVIDANTAESWGLINRAVPADHLLDEATALARRFANGPTRSYAHIRRLLLNSWASSLEEGLSSELAALGDVATTSDARIAIASFLDKRQPIFCGK